MDTTEAIRACEQRRSGGKHFHGSGVDATATPAIAAIVPVINVDFYGEMLPAVDARRLHAFLAVATDFSDWIRRRIAHFGFQIGSDFIVFRNVKENPAGGRPTYEYHVSLEMAKELSMVENNQEGRKARRYFIEAEKRLRQIPPAPAAPFALPQTFAAALRLAADQQDQIGKLEASNAILAPKAAALDAIADAAGLHTMQEAADICGTGRNTLFRHLRARGHLQQNNLPYRRHIERGLFVVRERPFTAQGTEHLYAQVYVTAKGLLWIQHGLTMGQKQLQNREART